MSRAVDDLVAEAGGGVSPRDANVLGVKVGAADATFRSTSFKKPQAAFAQKLPPHFKRLLAYGPRVALAAALSGFAWVAGLYFSDDQSAPHAVMSEPSPTVVARESMERAELLRMKQKMTEEIHTLQARIEALHGARSLNAKDATALDDMKRRLDGVKRETSIAIAELTGKVEHMQREITARFSQVTERADRTKRQLPDRIGESPRAEASELAVGSIPKQARKRRGDAFDPTQYRGAPGVPRPLNLPTQRREH